MSSNGKRRESGKVRAKPRRDSRGRSTSGRNGSGSRSPRSGNPRRKSSGARVIEFPRSRPSGASRYSGRSSSSSGARAIGRRRVAAVLAAFSLASLLLLGRAVHMTLAEEPRFEVLSMEGASQPLHERGSILSADGRELATSIEVVKVVATPYQVEDPDSASRELAEILSPTTDQSVREIEDLLEGRGEDGEPRGYSVISTVEPHVAEEVASLDIEGVFLEPSAERVYPDGSLASQTIGHVGDYGEAFGGVEARYDETLASGEDVNLTLNSAVQEELEAALRETVEENRADNAVGLVMSVEDGGIVALANHPSYDNNEFNSASAEAQRNRVLTDPYEPGSTFKPFTIAAALEEGGIDEDSMFTVPDQIPVADRIIHDSMPHPAETMTPEDILERSSNVGTVQIAQIMGGELIDEYIHRFGFGQKTGVDLWGEDAGKVPRFEEWSGASIGNIPIGQGLTMTPLQLAAGYAALINGGSRVEPHIIQRETRPQPDPSMISEETSTIVRGMLQSVVESGTGHRAQVPGYTVAGKTGTSQKVDPETGTYGEEYYASFIGFAPASDPEYLTLIVVDEPRKSIWGERVAAPAFQKVMRFTLSYFNVPPDDAGGAS
ncbi:MAG: peptidoglycan D,D-transpeptidase FtsI family protein [Rubrobacteraceae bacterium]